MKILAADYVYIDAEYRKDFAVVFGDRIIEAAPYTEIIEKYRDAELLEQTENSVLYPGFINTHTHLEFTANRTSLEYGSFLPWLYSVIADRGHLTEQCNTETMLEACNEMLKSGITAFGAISSMGLDLEACKAAPQRVIYFNELIGSDPNKTDEIYESYMKRYDLSAKQADDRLVPAIAIHSPYSVQPSIRKRAVEFAKTNKLPLTTHFLESQAEREWLDHSDGEFKAFFENFFNQSKALSSIDEYLSEFDGYPTHFVHCVQASDKELEKIAREKHTIAHCPRSNRLLGCGRLALDKVVELNISYSIATDGLSSNYSLNIFDELRAALMMHSDSDLHSLSKKLIESVTYKAADAIKLESGRIEKGYPADFALIELPEKPKIEKDIALWTILFTEKAKQVFIDGEQYI